MLSVPHGVHGEDCEGWWLCGCRGSVASSVLGSTPGNFWQFHFPLFLPEFLINCLVTMGTTSWSSCIGHIIMSTLSCHVYK